MPLKSTQLFSQVYLEKAAAWPVAVSIKVVIVKKGLKLAECGLEGQKRSALAHRARSSFGYNNLVVYYRSLPQLQALGCPVIFDGEPRCGRGCARTGCWCSDVDGVLTDGGLHYDENGRVLKGFAVRNALVV